MALKLDMKIFDFSQVFGAASGDGRIVEEIHRQESILHPDRGSGIAIDTDRDGGYLVQEPTVPPELGRSLRPIFARAAAQSVAPKPIELALLPLKR